MSFKNGTLFLHYYTNEELYEFIKDLIINWRNLDNDLNYKNNITQL